MDDIVFEKIKNQNDVNKNDEITINRQSTYIILGTLFLGILFNILFYKKSIGLSYPIFVLSFYGVLIWVLKDRVKFKLNFAWFIGLAVIMLSLTYAIFSNPVFRALNFFAIPILIVVQTVLISENNKYKWYTIRFINEIFHGFFARTFFHINKPLKLIVKLVKKRSGPSNYAVIKKILIGLLLSLPLVIIVIQLLSSADDIFRGWIESIPVFFSISIFSDLGAQLLILIFVGSIIFSYLWSLTYDKTDDLKSSEDYLFKRVWDPVILVTVLIVLNIIYVAFTSIQFSYLFDSVRNVLHTDLTYSESARRGFFELIFVTLINVSILVAGINLTRKEGKMFDKILKALYVLLIVCTMVILLSAHFKMSLYEIAYGYTYLRVLTHAFMAYIFVLLIVAILKLFIDRLSLAKSYIVISVIAYIIVNYMNIDVIIAKNNIARSRIDTHYITSLSYDAVPYMVGLLDNDDKFSAQKIENHLYNIKENLKAKKDWQSFNVSQFLAKKILEEHELRIEAPKVKLENIN